MAEEQQVYIEDLEEIKEENLLQLVGFKLGDEEYAIDVLKIQEIIRLVEITSVPRTDSFVLGVMNLRGQVIPVIDLRVRFNLERTDFDKLTRIIVVKFDSEHVGFVVDEVTEVIRIDKNSVEPTPPLVGSIGQEYILGICKYDERLIILLDIDRVIYEEGKYTESNLRKRFLGKDEIASITAEEKKEELKENPKEQSAPVVEEKDNEDAELSEEPDENEDLEVSSEDADIDALIAKELEKREKETEEMLKKKNQIETQESENSGNSSDDSEYEDILNDAVSQASSVVSGESNHVEQDDLDALIAKELEKREKETEEMLKKKKAEKKSEINSENDSESQSTEIQNIEKGSEDNRIYIERDSVDDLKNLARKIINGEIKELDFDVKSEVGELLRLILETKKKIDDIEPTIQDSSEQIPYVADTLERVNEETEQAALNLVEASDDMAQFYLGLREKLEKVEKFLDKNDSKSALEEAESIGSTLHKAEDLGFKILQSLEFQDITEQKISKVTRYIEDIGARLGAILGFVTVSKMQSQDEEEKVSSQSELDGLLKDYGLA